MSRFRTLTALLSAFCLAFGVPAQAADNISDGQWYHAFLRTAEAHAISQGEGVTVAILDSGVQASHPALAGSVLPGKDFTGDGDGTTDIDGHGTRMAGLVVAHGRVNGVAPKAKVLVVRVATVGGGDSATLAQGMLWAIANGAKVLVISSGGDPDSRLEFALKEAAKADVVVVAAAGNFPDDFAVTYPAAYPDVLAVASVDRNGNRAAHSVSGREVVIAAPGEDVSSTTKDGGFSVISGTSYSTPIVAGAVALVRAKYPQLRAADVIQLLTSTATDKGTPGRDNEYGFGVLNIVGALTAELPAATTAPATASNSPSTTPSSPAEPSDSGFPWWLIACPVIIVLIAGAAGIVFVARRGRS